MSMILEARKHSSSATDVDLSPLKSVIIQLDFPTFQLLPLLLCLGKCSSDAIICVQNLRKMNVALEVLEIWPNFMFICDLSKSFLCFCDLRQKCLQQEIEQKLS